MALHAKMLDMVKKIALGADHAGFEEKEKVKKTLDELGIAYEDMGTMTPESVDYPDYAQKVAESVANGKYEQGLLVCGSGTGMAIAANKVKGVRAAVAWSPQIAALARQHNDANILSLPARFLNESDSAAVVKAFFESDFEGGRHERRVEKIKGLEDADFK
ncbi:MAG TPA: ribose 5-phosphate isomerase B [Pyrinomonadaceae bacterium]|nr:ribose 5-phosphate isomerase B [Pyrinomonadaceae bacterium]